ncbi:uncharacterized protein BDV17DRAFT_272018 [Aspergillus undulatus]|uniref:uncharacterized protein n=1 Tax=Aspergillus undulatus TaxID=1810928 RepID=UPI003CCDD4C2
MNKLVTRSLYKRSAALDFEDQGHAMIWAVKKGNMSALKKLIPYNKIIMGTAALRIAVELGNEKALDILLKGGADPWFSGFITDEEKHPQHRMLQHPFLHAGLCTPAFVVISVL